MTLAVALISLVVSRVAGDDSYHVLNGTSAAPTRCLDGSPAGLYFRASRSGSSRFVLYLEGGSDCADGERCAAVLAAGRGTDAGLPPTLAQYFGGKWDGAALIDPSADANPDFHDANVAYLPYCTADFHAGTRTAPVNGSYWFTGHHVVAAAVDFMLANGLAPTREQQQQQQQQAPLLVLAGGSSGGMGTIRNADAVRAQVQRAAPAAQFAAVPLGGFYFYQRPYTGKGSAPVGMDFSAAGFELAYPVHAAFVPQRCARAQPSAAQAWRCSQANVSLPFLASRVFAAEALTDRVVTTNHAGLPTLTRAIMRRNASDDDPLLAYVARYTGWMRDALRTHFAGGAAPPSERGLFAPACYDHTTFPTLGGPQIAGRSFLQVLHQWLFTADNNSSAGVQLMDSCTPLLCGAPSAIPALKLGSSCPDTPPGGGYSCAQQKSWGKCDAKANPWMIGYCCSTCFNCSAGCGAAPGTPTPPPAPAPTPAPAPPGPATRFEAEGGDLSGGTAVASKIKGYSGTGYVTGFTSSGGNVAIAFTVPSDGLYDIEIGYHAGYGDKGFQVAVNGGAALDGTFKDTGTAWGRVSAGKFALTAGQNKATILNGWGYFEVDFIDVSSAAAQPPKPPPKMLCDPMATTAARKMMSFLVDTFGHKVISGTQVRGPSLSAVSSALNASGKQPALIEAGLLDYSPSFVERAGNVTNGFVEAAGHWATTAGKGRGLLALCWHWNSPSDLMDTVAHPDPDHPWFQAFYTKNTNFDLSKAFANPMSPQYSKLLSDLDTIAVQLKKLAALDLPVLWRPLHEASGGWFWWGAHGPDCFKKLWTLMFTRFTQVHDLHNLIWVYTADAAHSDWYPGHAMVDVVGADIYEPTGATMDSTWEGLKAQYEGQKLITLSETGALIVPDAVRTYKTMWSWFNTWDITAYNITEQEIRTVYTDPDVLTLDTLPDWRA